MPKAASYTNKDRLCVYFVFQTATSVSSMTMNIIYLHIRNVFLLCDFNSPSVRDKGINVDLRMLHSFSTATPPDKLVYSQRAASNLQPTAPLFVSVLLFAQESTGTFIRNEICFQLENDWRQPPHSSRCRKPCRGEFKT